MTADDIGDTMQNGQKRALVVYGGLELHEPRQGAEKVADMLSSSGLRVTVTTDYDALVADDVAQMALVVPVITGGTIERARITPLLDAIRNGTGMTGYHHCMSTTFRDVPQFRYAAACTWVAHPGNIMRYRVRITAPDDPIMAGIEDFDHVSEQYYMHVDPAVEVLAETTFSGEHDPWRRDVVMPVTFKTHYGKGRVFFTSLGHTASELDQPNLRPVLHRGLFWAAGGAEDQLRSIRYRPEPDLRCGGSVWQVWDRNQLVSPRPILTPDELLSRYGSNWGIPATDGVIVCADQYPLMADRYNLIPTR